MWRGPQTQGVPVRWTCIKALCPTPDASRKPQGILVLVLEEGHGGQAGTTVPIFQIGKQAQRGKGTHPRSDSPTSSWRTWAGLRGWVNIRTFPTMGSSTEPQVSAPQCTTPDKKSAMRAPATVDKKSMSWGGGGAVDKREIPAHSPPQIRKSLTCSLTHSLICWGRRCPFSAWDTLFPVNGVSGITFLASICPFTCSSPGRCGASFAW